VCWMLIDYELKNNVDEQFENKSHHPIVTSIARVGAVGDVGDDHGFLGERVYTG
jgi:hypothetical protein